MSMEIASAAAGASYSPHSGGRPLATAPPPNLQSTQVVPLSNDVQGKASGQAEKTQYSEAVKATPSTSSAIKTEFGSEPSVDLEMLQYPITGPDKFAKSVAVMNAQEDEARDENASQETPATLEGSQKSVSILEAAVLAGEGERTGSAQADEKDTSEVMAASEQPAGSEQSTSGIVKTAPEAAQTQLTS